MRLTPGTTRSFVLSRNWGRFTAAKSDLFFERISVYHIKGSEGARVSHSRTGGSRNITENVASHAVAEFHKHSFYEARRFGFISDAWLVGDQKPLASATESVQMLSTDKIFTW